MNRKQRRAEAAKARATKMRHTAIENALAYMAGRNDETITGATLFLPDGSMLHVDADAARAQPRHGERPH